MRLRRILRAIAVGSAVHIVMFLLVVSVLDLAFSTEVQFIAPNPPEVVEVNRSLWMKGDPVVDIYGVATEQPAAIVFADAERMIRPAEDASLLLYTVDKQAGENPLQVKTLWFMLLRFSATFVLIGGLAAGALFWLRRRDAATT